MKHIPTFESFVAQLNEWKKPKVEDLVHDMKVKITRGRHAGATGTIHDFQLTDKGDLVDDQIDVLVDQPGKPFAYLGLDDIMVESFLSEEVLNEDSSLALALILQAAMVNGLLIGHMAANASGDGFHPIEDLKAWWAKRKRDKAVQSIVDKLKDDPEVIAFMNQSSSAQRGKWYKLIEPKLSDDEKQYLKSINKTQFK